MNPFVEFLSRNRRALIGLLIGIVCAILFLTIGFWPTFLIIVLGCAGAVIGNNSIIKKWFSGIFGNGDDDDF